jgi:hypothetical protein
MEDIETVVKKYTDICIDGCFNPWVLANKENLDSNKPIEDVYQDDYLGDYGSTQLGDIILDEMDKGEKIAIINDFCNVDDIYYGKNTNEDNSPALLFLNEIEIEVTDILSDMNLTVEEYINEIDE